MRRGVNNNNDGWFGHNRWTYGTGSGSQISTAKLLKTGQTISYATNDDGDLEIGRDDSFLVLAENNPFGNTDRFTAPDGTQTYTDNIVIDWSTYDGAEVNGWYRVKASAAIWDTAIDNCLAASHGGFTSGWRMPNVVEMFSIAKWSNTITQLFYYAPFNHSTPNMWTSTTDANNTANAYYFVASTTLTIFISAKSASLAYMKIRTFTVSGTTLT